jgi:glycosyltransferase involved in cell wall biosynthesis
LIHKKHPLELLSALHAIAAQAPQAELLIVGDGELRKECEAYARQHSLPVRFAGFLNQSSMVEAYAASDCLVLPSDHGETWGLVVNEAMACGRPAIVSDEVGCSTDLIVPGETGCVFRFGDWSQLSESIRLLSNQPALLRRMGDNARKRIAGYSPGAAADGIWQSIQYTCGTAPRR